MTNIEPHVEVYDVEQITQTSYGNAGKIALIGAFPCDDFSIGLFTRSDDAKNAVLGEYKSPEDNSVENASKDPVPATFTSFFCLDYIFNSNNQSRGAESVLLVNTNYGAGTLSPAVTNSQIADAFQLLMEEDFDILTFAVPIALTATVDESLALNPVFETIKAFVDSQYFAQRPFGLITGIDITSATTTILGDFKTLFADKGIYKAVVTPVKINGDSESLTIAQSGCWHSAFTAGRAVNKSETAKTYDGIIGQNTKDDFPMGGTVTWKNLLNNGFHTTKFKNRRLSTIQCLSNVTPADYDMKIERVKNYIIKRLTLSDILGEDNIRPTRDYLKGLFEYERQLAMANNYLVDMEYELINIDTDKVQAELKLYIPDIIRVVVLNVQLNISAYEEGA